MRQRATFESQHLTTHGLDGHRTGSARDQRAPRAGSEDNAITLLFASIFCRYRAAVLTRFDGRDATLDDIDRPFAPHCLAHGREQAQVVDEAVVVIEKCCSRGERRLQRRQLTPVEENDFGLASR